MMAASLLEPVTYASTPAYCSMRPAGVPVWTSPGRTHLSQATGVAEVAAAADMATEREEGVAGGGCN